ncbi:MAG: molybdate ABC transporter substrate-binding protein [Gallionellaceae bacterium]
MRHLLGFFLLFGCSVLAQAAPLTVAVAANVKYAFDDLALEFKSETGIELQGVLGSSGKITAQVMHGAPFDVFLSADMKYPGLLYRNGLAVAEPKVYAYGALVLWTTKNLDLSEGLAILADRKIQKIALANPKLAPYGYAAAQVLNHAKLATALKPKLVYGESISQAAQYVYSGAADIGFLAKSVALAPTLKGKGKWLELPKASYDPIAHGVVILKHGSETQPQIAHQFVDFLFTAKAHTIFEKYGYLLP